MSKAISPIGKRILMLNPENGYKILDYLIKNKYTNKITVKISTNE